MASQAISQEEKRNQRRERLLNEPIPRVVTAMAVPTILSSVVMSLYNMADTYFVSSLGTAATAAVGVNHSLQQLIQMAGSAIGIGASSYISRLLGAKEDKKASQVMSTTFFTAFSIGLLVLILGMIFMRPMVRLLGATEDVIPYSIDYASYILYAAPFMATVFVMNQTLRAEGSAAFAALGTVSGSILNCILDPIFIFVLDFGVAGAAMATAISKMVSFCVLITPYLRHRSLLNLHVRYIHYSKDIVAEVSKIGSPTLIRQGLMMIANVITNNVAGAFSTSALAAISVVNRLMMFLGSAIMGFGHGFQSVAGFNWGAKRYDRVRSSFIFAATCGTIVVSVLALLAAIFPTQIIGLFTEADAEMMRIGVFSLVFRCAVMPLHAIVMVSQSCFTALGKAKQAAILSLSRQGFCLIPCVAILPVVFGIMGLGAAQGVADILSFGISFPMTLKLLREVKRMGKDYDSQSAASPSDLPLPEAPAEE